MAALIPHADADTSWIFDLDNTLYPAHCKLFDQVDRRIGLYIERHLNLDTVAARALQKEYFRTHQTTLRGLMTNHDVDPADFLDFVHQIDLSAVARDEHLDAALTRLPGRKIVFTNGSVRHAENVLARLGVSGHFEGIFDIVAAAYRPKPSIETYRAFIERYDIAAERAVMIDDMPRNLEPAAALGMVTVLIETDDEWAQPQPGMTFIHHKTGDLAAWLAARSAEYAAQTKETEV